MLNIINAHAVTPDDEKRYDGSDPNNLVLNRLCWREITISVRIETHDHSDVGEAFNKADQLITYLGSFNDQSSLNTTSDVQTVTYIEDDRDVSVAVYDMKWNVLINKTDPNSQDYFSQVEVISEIEDETEQLLPSPPNFDVLIPATLNLTPTLGVGTDTLTDGADVLLDA